MNNKNLANTITVSRIIVSISMVFVIPFSSTFFLLYSFCGISDIIDGFVARKTHTESVLGALLDSIADIVFLCILGVIAAIEELLCVIFLRRYTPDIRTIFALNLKG